MEDFFRHRLLLWGGSGGLYCPLAVELLDFCFYSL